MLSIQPKFNINQQSFGKSDAVPVVIVPQTGALPTLYKNPEGPRNRKYTPYEEISSEIPSSGPGVAPGADIDDIAGSQHEFNAAIQDMRDSVKDLADSAKDVPIIQKSTSLFSKFLNVAIGWAGLRWGTYGTFKVLSKMGKLKPAMAVTDFVKKHGKSVVDFVKGNKISLALGEKMAQIKSTTFVTNMTGTKFYEKMASVMGSVKGFIKKINPKQVVAETMGVAGGATAAINQFGSNNPSDGTMSLEGEFRSAA